MRWRRRAGRFQGRIPALCAARWREGDCRGAQARETSAPRLCVPLLGTKGRADGVLGCPGYLSLDCGGRVSRDKRCYSRGVHSPPRLSGSPSPAGRRPRSRAPEAPPSRQLRWGTVFQPLGKVSAAAPKRTCCLVLSGAPRPPGRVPSPVHPPGRFRAPSGGSCATPSPRRAPLPADVPASRLCQRLMKK